MKKILPVMGLLCLWFSYAATAQKAVDINRVRQLVIKNAAALGLSQTDVANTRISDAYYDQRSGAIMAYLQQTFNGVDISNAITSVAFKNDLVASVQGDRIAEVEKLVTNANAKPSISSITALMNAASDLKLPLMQPVIAALSNTNNGKELLYDGLGISFNRIPVRLVWASAASDDHLFLSWQVEINTITGNDYWLVKVDAGTGKILRKDNLTVTETFEPVNLRKMDCYQPAQNNLIAGKQAGSPAGAQAITSSVYNVVSYPAESPVHPGGNPALVTNPWEAFANANATTVKWNSDGNIDYNKTRGNNVWAKADVTGSNSPTGYSPTSSTSLPDLTFNFTPDLSQDPIEDFPTQSFAITNLFYWNNLMHDMSYEYGFDEVAGNFQDSNLARGGKENDFVFADAQDGSGTNNANFSTPADGGSGRMQMFLWSGSPLKTMFVNSPEDYSGFKAATESGFSNKNKLSQTGAITGDVVLYKDVDNENSHRACIGPSNGSEFAGKIVYIDRGGCTFVIKVKNAQVAGAKAVIVGDSLVGSTTPITMGGTDNTITVPAVFIAYDEAQNLKGFLNQGTTVNVTLSPSVQIDGDLDNGVIAHEYGHGISTRLTGGPSNSNCLNNGEEMGEGWSDYFGLMITTNWATATTNDGPIPRPIGNYVVGLTPDYGGIRHFPYSTDFAINPLTYDTVKKTGGEVHWIGEVWTQMLWDMTWDLIQTDGINTDFFNSANPGGNSVSMALVMTGMKLQKCSPGFVDGRDAILKADTLLYGGKYSPTIWKAFAKRGLGALASQGSSNNTNDGIPDYSLPTILPVIFGSFTAEKLNNTALLKWTTVTEINTDKFIIERSTDGRTYGEVGSIKAAGNSNTTQSYQYTDIRPVKGNNMYRIRQVDRDGKYNYSDLRTLSFDELKKLISVTPNPAKDKAVITVAGNTKTLQIKVLNNIGQQVASYTLSGESMPVDVSRLSKGVYYVTVTGEGINAKEKLVIQ